MPYEVEFQALSDVLVLRPRVFQDDRGFFLESFNERDFAAVVGREVHFVQDNHSRSVEGVLRGMHYQIHHPQGKLVRVVRGEVFDVAVDLRRSSASFGKWFGVHLSEENMRLMWVPEGFAHGFLVLSESADFLYKTTDYWYPEYDRSLLWNDPELGIEWPLRKPPILNARDAAGSPLAEAEVFA